MASDNFVLPEIPDGFRITGPVYGEPEQEETAKADIPPLPKGFQAGTNPKDPHNQPIRKLSKAEIAKAKIIARASDERASWKSTVRRSLRYGGAGLGAVIGAIATGVPTMGGAMGAGGLGGAGIGWGVGDVLGNLVYGPDPEKQIPPSEEKRVLKQPNVLKGLVREGLKPHVLMRSGENLAAAPYEITKSITTPVLEGDFGGAGSAAAHAGLGLLEYPATAMGLKDLWQKFKGTQPMDFQMRELQYMAENDPLGLAMGIKIGSHAPRLGKEAIKGGARATVRAMTDEKSASNLYRSAMKPTIKEGKAAEVDKAINTGLETGAVINRKGKGLQKTYERVEALEDQVNGVLDPVTNTVNVEAMDRSMDGVRKAAFDDLNHRDIIHSVADKYIRMLREHPKYDAATDSVPVQTTNTIKRRLYKDLRKGGAYDIGQVLSGKGTAAKGMANVLMQSIEEAVPEIGPLNKKLGEYLNLQKYLERATSRIENTDVLGMRTRLAMLMGVAAPKYAVVSLMSAIFDNPSFKSRLAIAIHKANKGRFTTAQVRKMVDDIPEKIRTTVYPDDFEPNAAEPGTSFGGVEHGKAAEHPVEQSYGDVELRPVYDIKPAPEPVTGDIPLEGNKTPPVRPTEFDIRPEYNAATVNPVPETEVPPVIEGNATPEPSKPLFDYEPAKDIDPAAKVIPEMEESTRLDSPDINRHDLASIEADIAFLRQRGVPEGQIQARIRQLYNVFGKDSTLDMGGYGDIELRSPAGADGKPVDLEDMSGLDSRLKQLNIGIPKAKTETPTPAGSPGGRAVSPPDVSPQSKSNINLNAVRAKLRSFGFDEKTIDKYLKSSTGKLGAAAALTSLYAIADDETKKKMLGIPLLAGLIFPAEVAKKIQK
jgi:hypothetical protein